MIEQNINGERARPDYEMDEPKWQIQLSNQFTGATQWMGSMYKTEEEAINASNDICSKCNNVRVVLSKTWEYGALGNGRYT